MIHRISNLTGILCLPLSTLLFTSTSFAKDTSYKDEIMVFAAASLVDVLTEVSDSFELQYHIKIKSNPGSSGTLARQLEQGGSADVFISASRTWMNYVDSLGYMLKDYITEVAKNELVLITPINSTIKETTIDTFLDFKSLLGSGRLSMGDPAHVPAGKYAKEALDFYGWYESLKSKILPAKDVRSALMIVELGETPLGIVYKTDAMKSNKVKTIASFPQNSHKPIVYMAGVCRGSSSGKLFFEYLNSTASKTIWLKYGFKK